MSAPVLLAVRNGVADIRFNRPARLNALDLEMVLAFEDAVSKAVADAGVRAILLSAEGDNFVSGGDLAFLRQAPDRMEAARQLIEPLHRAVAQLADAPVPTLAMLQGAVAGAGMSLALIVDLAIAADNVRFSFAYGRVAVNPDGGGSWSLPRLVGLRRALEIYLLSPTLDAGQAERLGLVNKIVPPEQLKGEAWAWAERLAAGPTGAFSRARKLLRAAFDHPLEDHLHREAAGFTACVGEPNFQEALDAFFERRPARFS